jgi:hypothetical protein
MIYAVEYADSRAINNNRCVHSEHRVSGATWWCISRPLFRR